MGCRGESKWAGQGVLGPGVGLPPPPFFSFPFLFSILLFILDTQFQISV
jgi:hypothetical protein